MSMKEAFDIYFNKLNDYWQRTKGCYPKTVYIEKCDKHSIYIPGTIQNGYAQWRPILQTEPVDFELIEKELEITIHVHLKEYFSTYWFMQLGGDAEGNGYYLGRIPPNTNIPMFVKKCRQEGDIDYLNGVFFAIGDADINGNQDCGLYVNNDNGEVICVDWDLVRHHNFQIPLSETSFKIANSLVELITNFEEVY